MEAKILREQNWTVSFETSVLKCFFRGINFEINIEVCFLKCIFWESIFDNYFRLLVATFFIKFFTTSKASLVLACLNINLELLIIGCNQARYVSRRIYLEYLSPLGKSSGSLDKGWLGSTWWPMEWHGIL